MNNYNLTLFEEKYIPEPNSGCFLWMAAQHRQGYGNFHHDGKCLLAHRVSWELYRGEIPHGMKVLHKCDNEPCVNPDHLFLGTQSDNMFDCGRKGRSNKAGSINGHAKLTEEDVRIIRAAKPSYGSRQRLAKRFGVTPANISQLRHKPFRTWKGI
jgi:hypothetical protein